MQSTNAGLKPQIRGHVAARRRRGRACNFPSVVTRRNGVAKKLREVRRCFRVVAYFCDFEPNRITILATQQPGRSTHLFTKGNSLNNLRTRPIEQDTRRRLSALDGRKLGTEAHNVIGDVLASGRRSVPYPELLVAVDRYASALQQKRQITYRQSARQHLVTTTRLYLSFFLPEEQWSFVGADVSHAGCQFDLVWLDTEGLYWVDELKTGRGGAKAGMAALEDQVKRQLDSGNALWGSAFGGVRACILHAPKRSFARSADGLLMVGFSGARA
jgi:hypothetical protein